MTDPQGDLKAMTANVVGAYVSHNSTAAAQLSALIEGVYAALARLGQEPTPAEAPPAHAPAVTVRKSLASRDHIISMIDGKPYMILRRHLTTHGLTPDAYRARYGLPADYPMVAKAYSEKRSAMAKAIGLGNKGGRRKAQAKGATRTRSAPRTAAARAQVPDA